LSKIEEFEQLHKQTGWGLIPLEGKRPIEKDWTKWCKVKRPFNKDDFRNGKNAGAPCGPANGILVIDVDDIEKFNSWLDEKKFDLPLTRTHMTGSGKPHYIYEYPIDGKVYGNRSFKDPGGQVDSITGKVKSIFDIRGLGGQVVTPGSIHPDTQKEYTVRHDIDIAPAPGWLTKLAIQDAASEPIETGKHDLEGLNLPYPIKRLIEQGESNGKRSEAIMSVLNALVKASASDITIIGIFEDYAIGEKYLEKGSTRRKWLLEQVAKIRKSNPVKVTGMTFEDLETEFSGEIDYLWRKHIPKALPSMISGREGSGKTTACLQICKEILENESEGVIIWIATEGFVRDTVNKMKTMGINSPRFQVPRKSDKSFRFNLFDTRDLEQIKAYFTHLTEPILLVVIDSLRGASNLDANEDKMRIPIMNMSSIVCDTHNAACLWIHHNNKTKRDNLLDNVAGSPAITAAVRQILHIKKKSAYVRLIEQSKTNIEEAPPLEMLKSGKDIIIKEPTIQSEERQTDQAEAFLVETFKNSSSQLATDVYSEAEEKGILEHPLKDAKKRLGIQSQKVGEKWMWVWQI